MPDKKMKYVIIAILLILAAGSIFYFTQNEKIILPSSSEKKVSQNQQNEQNPVNNEIENSNQNSGGGISSGGSSSGGSSGGAGGASGSQTNPAIQQSPTCEEIQISYSLKNLEVNSTCLNFENGNCVEKNVKCELEVENLDSEVSGIFTIQFDFIDAERNIISSATDSQSVNSDSQEIFTAQNNFSPPNSEEEISCSFRTLEVPKKEFCS